MKNSAPPGPVLLIEPPAALLQRVLQRQPDHTFLCASASPDHLEKLRDLAGAVPDIVFYCGGVAAVLREFPLFWSEIYLQDSASIAALADSLAAGGRLHWQAQVPAQAVAIATGLVERGCYATFEAGADGVTLTAVTGTPAQAGTETVAGWRSLRSLLDAINLRGPDSVQVASAAIRRFRHAWLLPVERRLRGGWPFGGDVAPSSRRRRGSRRARAARRGWSDRSAPRSVRRRGR